LRSVHPFVHGKSPAYAAEQNSRAFGATFWAPQSLPPPAKHEVFEISFFRIFFKGMKKEQKRENSFNSGEKKSALSSLPKMEMYAVLGLELMQNIYKKVESIEDSIAVSAAQEARELNPEDLEVGRNEKTS